MKSTEDADRRAKDDRRNAGDRRTRDKPIDGPDRREVDRRQGERRDKE
jgi:hypothetical protein